MRRISAIVVALAILGIGALAQAGALSLGPDRPDWVRQDGTVDESKRPERIPVVGPDGELVRDKNGKPVTIDFDELLDLDAPPPDHQEPLVQDPVTGAYEVTEVTRPPLPGG